MVKNDTAAQGKRTLAGRFSLLVLQDREEEMRDAASSVVESTDTPNACGALVCIAVWHNRPVEGGEVKRMRLGISYIFLRV